MKVNENKPNVLLKKISMNKDEKRRIFIFLFFSKVANSLFILEVILLIKILYGEFSAQKEGSIIIMKPNKLIQFNDRPNIDTGSKIENRLFIIFNYGH